VADSGVDYRTRMLTYLTLTVMDDVLCADLQGYADLRYRIATDSQEES
jgi:hypothetical protein